MKGKALTIAEGRALALKVLEDAERARAESLAREAVPDEYQEGFAAGQAAEREAISKALASIAATRPHTMPCECVGCRMVLAVKERTGA